MEHSYIRKQRNIQIALLSLFKSSTHLCIYINILWYIFRLIFLHVLEYTLLLIHYQDKSFKSQPSPPIVGIIWPEWETDPSKGYKNLYQVSWTMDLKLSAIQKTVFNTKHWSEAQSFVISNNYYALTCQLNNNVKINRFHQL